MREVDLSPTNGQLLLRWDETAIHCEGLVGLSGLTISLTSQADLHLILFLVYWERLCLRGDDESPFWVIGPGRGGF